jgi:DUF1365 family protein
MTTEACLYLGDVVHVRTRPRRHRLRYGVFSMLVDLDGLPALDRRSKLFSLNRFNLFSFHDRDHGDGLTPPRAWVECQLRAAGIELEGGAICVLCYPRILGYVFNPVSVFFCYRGDDELEAVLYEVHNTFGERHSYLIPIDSRDAGPIRQSCPKRFHVSPFIAMDGRYDFRIKEPDETVVLTIAESDAEGTLLQASFVGRRTPLNDRTLLAAFFRYPLMTLKVVAGIHWEALKIWRKGARFHHKPAPPNEPVTLVVGAEDKGMRR